MANYEAVDLRFSADGDLIVDGGGKMLDSATFPLLSLKQEIITRVLSNIGDWNDHPWLGTNMQAFIGEPNNEDTIQKIVSSLRHGLTVDNLVSNDDLEILWAKWDVNTLAMVVVVEVGGLSAENEGKLEIPFVFDFEDLGAVTF